MSLGYLVFMKVSNQYILWAKCYSYELLNGTVLQSSSEPVKALIDN